MYLFTPRSRRKQEFFRSLLGRWFAKKTGQPEPEKIDRIDWPQNQSPYPGLMWFNDEYASLFFGRDREVEAVLAKMCQPQGRFLVISGASGAGKSSLVAAGLWQALVKRGQLPGSRRWKWKRMTPGAGRWGPSATLAIGLQEAFPQLTDAIEELAALLENDAPAFGCRITTCTWSMGRSSYCLSINWKNCLLRGIRLM